MKKFTFSQFCKGSGFFPIDEKEKKNTIDIIASLSILQAVGGCQIADICYVYCQGALFLTFYYRYRPNGHTVSQ